MLPLQVHCSLAAILSAYSDHLVPNQKRRIVPFEKIRLPAEKAGKTGERNPGCSSNMAKVAKKRAASQMSKRKNRALRGSGGWCRNASAFRRCGLYLPSWEGYFLPPLTKLVFCGPFCSFS